jgi:hypothetical protein
VEMLKKGFVFTYDALIGALIVIIFFTAIMANSVPVQKETGSAVIHSRTAQDASALYNITSASVSDVENTCEQQKTQCTCIKGVKKEDEKTFCAVK